MRYLAGLVADLNPPELASRRLCVWRVVLSGDGADAQLSARHINSFWTNGNGEIQAVSLLGDYFARALMGGFPIVSHAEVFQWKQSTSNVHCKTSFRLDTDDSVVSYI